MNRAVVLIGTSHAYQRGEGSCSASEVRAFQDFISAQCHKWQVQLVSEEMSEGALKEWGLIHSTVYQVASTNHLPHRYIDPDRTQKHSLGIFEDDYVKIQGQSEKWTDSEIDRRIRLEYRKRESLWLWSLLVLNQWPSLFICGSDHVEPFSKLLQESNIAVHIAATNWAP